MKKKKNAKRKKKIKRKKRLNVEPIQLVEAWII